MLDDKQKQTVEKIKAICAIIGARLEPQDDSFWSVQLTATFPAPDGLSVFFSDRGARLDVFHQRPRHNNGKGCQPNVSGNPPFITVSLARTAEAIAADITRRLLPDARTDLAICLEQMERECAFEEQRAITRRCLEEVGVSFHEYASIPYTGYICGSCCSVRISSGESVTFERITLDRAGAVALCRLLNEVAKAKK